MNAQLVIGPILLIVGIIVSLIGWSARNAPPEPREPKSGDMRIVQQPSGRFGVERFHAYPAWEKWDEFSTLEEAKKQLELWGPNAQEPKVIETVLAR